MPRAPRARVVGRQAVGKAFGVFDQMSRIRSMPLRSPRSTRLTRSTGASRPSGARQRRRRSRTTRAPTRRRGRGKVDGDGFQRGCDALGGGVPGRTRRTFCRGFCAPDGDRFGSGARRCFLGFFDISAVPTAQPYRALEGPASGLNEGPGHVAIGPAAAIVRANLPEPATCPSRYAQAWPVLSCLTRIVRMLITPAYAQAAAGGDANSMLMSLLPFALIFVIMYFLILRPQQKKVKDHQELVKTSGAATPWSPRAASSARSPRWWTTTRSSSRFRTASACGRCGR